MIFNQNFQLGILIYVNFYNGIIILNFMKTKKLMTFSSIVPLYFKNLKRYLKRKLFKWNQLLRLKIDYDITNLTNKKCKISTCPAKIWRQFEGDNEDNIN